VEALTMGMLILARELSTQAIEELKQYEESVSNNIGWSTKPLLYANGYEHILVDVRFLTWFYSRSPLHGLYEIQ
jgi:hypothetical protein